MVAIPALLAVASLALGPGDFRSGGLMAGVAPTIAGCAVLFLQAQFGWFGPTDAYGPRAVVAVDGSFVVVSDERDGVVVLRSGDGRTWTRTNDVPVLDGLRVRDAIAADDEMLAIGQPTDSDVAHVVTTRDGRTWRATSRCLRRRDGRSRHRLRRRVHRWRP